MKTAQTQPTMKTPGETIGEIVAGDYRTAIVFESHGIDFCCGGKNTLEATCREQKIDFEGILEEIEAVRKEPLDRGMRYDSWELPFLADYIINVHHSYLKENTSQVSAYARKTATVHGARHPEVKEISRIFDQTAAELAIHMQNGEEELLFPAIKRAAGVRKSGSTPDPKDRETIRKSVLKLTHEHEEIGAAIHAIRRLSRDYVIPLDACNTFVVTYQRLKAFEEDLHKHVHLENNILFLKAVQL